VPDPQVAAAVRAMYGGKKPLAVTVRERLGGWVMRYSAQSLANLFRLGEASVILVPLDSVPEPAGDDLAGALSKG
jgi:hypothetical protein